MSPVRAARAPGPGHRPWPVSIPGPAAGSWRGRRRPPGRCGPAPAAWARRDDRWRSRTASDRGSGPPRAALRPKADQLGFPRFQVRCLPLRMARDRQAPEHRDVQLRAGSSCTASGRTACAGRACAGADGRPLPVRHADHAVQGAPGIRRGRRGQAALLRQVGARAAGDHRAFIDLLMFAPRSSTRSREGSSAAIGASRCKRTPSSPALLQHPRHRGPRHGARRQVLRIGDVDQQPGTVAAALQAVDGHAGLGEGIEGAQLAQG